MHVSPSLYLQDCRSLLTKILQHLKTACLCCSSDNQQDDDMAMLPDRCNLMYVETPRHIRCNLHTMQSSFHFHVIHANSIKHHFYMQTGFILIPLAQFQDNLCETILVLFASHAPDCLYRLCKVCIQYVINVYTSITAHLNPYNYCIQFGTCL